jgi:hypothetical protein
MESRGKWETFVNNTYAGSRLDTSSVMPPRYQQLFGQSGGSEEGKCHCGK